MSFDLNLQGYTAAQSRRFDANLLAKASVIPGLQSVGIISNLPLRIGENDSPVMRADLPVMKPSDWHAAITYNISPGYFKAAGTRLLAGRDINTQHREGSPAVAIVNQALVRLLFRSEPALGKHLRTNPDSSDRGVEIVGVAETGKYGSIGEDPQPALFLPVAQSETSLTTLIARSSLDPETATESLRKAVLNLDPQLTLFNTGSLIDQLAFPLCPARICALILGIFGILALTLAATGLFALMAYSVSRRTHEIGIRMALGARPAQVLFSVLRRTLLLCLVGASLGIIAAFFAAHLLSAVLYGISPHDPAAYAVTLLLLTAIACLACWYPARRAVLIDPALTLRE